MDGWALQDQLKEMDESFTRRYSSDVAPSTFSPSSSTSSSTTLGSGSERFVSLQGESSLTSGAGA
eukprot:246089-Hanusia_phi.AAC.1